MSRARAARPGAERPIIDADYEEVGPHRGRDSGPRAQRVEARPVADPPPAPAPAMNDPHAVHLAATVRPTGLLGALFDAVPVSLRVPIPPMTPSAKAGLAFGVGMLGGAIAAHLNRKPAKLPEHDGRGDEDDDSDSEA